MLTTEEYEAARYAFIKELATLILKYDATTNKQCSTITEETQRYLGTEKDILVKTVVITIRI